MNIGSVTETEEENRINQDIHTLDKRIKMFTVIGWSFIILGIILAVVGVIYQFNGNSNIRLSEIGDYIGGTVASTWSLAGLFFIYVAFLGQQKQMLLQKLDLYYNRLEITATRKELEGQKEQMIEQNKAIKLQRFENTFFHMLSLHNEIIDKLLFETEYINFEKREYFKGAFHELKNQKNADLTLDYTDDSTTWNAINDGYRYFFFEHHSMIGHYFRNLYHIFKYIHLSELISEVDKQFYASLVRAQLSSYELIMMFYNSLIDGLGFPKFKYLIDKYDLLQNLDEDTLLNSEHWHFYFRIKVENPYSDTN